VTTDFSARDNVVVRGDVDAATYFHDSAVSLFQRMPPAQLSVLSYADAGVHLYGNAVLASTKLMQERPEALKGFLRATACPGGNAGQPPGRAGCRTPARPAAARRSGSRALGHHPRLPGHGRDQAAGLGRIVPAVLKQQIAEVGETFALGQLPAPEKLWNTAFLPTAVKQGSAA
jgi:hypothetical protein